jgi:hypothetical protein
MWPSEDRPQVKTIPELEEEPSGESAAGVAVASSVVGGAVAMRKQLTPAVFLFMETSPNLSRNNAFRTVVLPTDTLPSKAILISNE